MNLKAKENLTLLSPHLQGVIFAIDFHRDRLQICSASDDRSIRLWQLCLRGGDANQSSDLTMTHWEGVTFEPLFVYYGHSARVWGVRLLHEHIVSIGEVSRHL